MRERHLSAWSLPLGAIAGDPMRIHVVYLVVAVGLYLRTVFGNGAPAGIWREALLVQSILLLSVMARAMGTLVIRRLEEADHQDTIIWPLGHFSRIEGFAGASYWSLLSGTSVTLFFAAFSAFGLLAMGYIPPSLANWNPYGPTTAGTLMLSDFHGDTGPVTAGWATLLARISFVNGWLLFANLLPAYPLDASRLMARILWRRSESAEALQAVLTATMISIVGVMIAGIAMGEVLYLVLAMVVYMEARGAVAREREILGDLADGASYDNDGLPEAPERDPEPRESWWKRWRARRAEERNRRAAADRAQAERRMDELLDKLHRLGNGALTGAEHRFMREFSRKYRPRQRER